MGQISQNAESKYLITIIWGQSILSVLTPVAWIDITWMITLNNNHILLDKDIFLYHY